MWFTPLKTYPSSTSAKVPYGNRKGGESNASTKHIARGHVGNHMLLAMFVVRKESLFDSGLLDSVIVFISLSLRCVSVRYKEWEKYV